MQTKKKQKNRAEPLDVIYQSWQMKWLNNNKTEKREADTEENLRELIISRGCRVNSPKVESQFMSC